VRTSLASFLSCLLVAEVVLDSCLILLPGGFARHRRRAKGASIHQPVLHFLDGDVPILRWLYFLPELNVELGPFDRVFLSVHRLRHFAAADTDQVGVDW